MYAILGISRFGHLHQRIITAKVKTDVMTEFKCVCASMLLLVSVSLHAEQEDVLNPTVYWTAELQKLVAGANARNADALTGKCSKCHGETGISDEADTPNIAAQNRYYTFKQLKHYQDVKPRDDRTMHRRVKKLSDQEMADLAAWYSMQVPAPAQDVPEPSTGTIKLVRQGDTERDLKACMHCHGAHGEGAPLDTPALAGQQIEYFVETAVAFRELGRADDIYRRMCAVSGELADEEIRGLAEYYAGLGPKPPEH